jgi:acyl-CoA dehydrogenase
MIERLLSGPVAAAPCEGVAQWWPRHRNLSVSGKNRFDHAIAGGLAADRVGWAFASGYQAALHALFPDAPDERICALCVTEADGNSPRAIKSSLRKDGNGWVLSGTKRWTTLGPEGSIFFVAARDEAASGGRAAIKIVQVLSGSAGLKIEVMPETKFVPEVPHARLQFENLKISDAAVLPGDGYAMYVKPFRTVEDIYVNSAILAYLAREARRLAWPAPWIERTYSVLIVFEELSRQNPSAPQTHIALAGALAIGAGLTAEADGLWDRTPADAAAVRWKRDRALFGVAAGARALRTERAWEQLVGRLPTP